MHDKNNHAFVEQIKSALRYDECIVESIEIEEGRTLIVKIRYFSKEVDLLSVVDKVRKIYNCMKEELLKTELLVEVLSEDDNEFFDPLFQN